MTHREDLAGRFVQVRTRAVRGHLAAHYARVLVTATSKTGLTVAWQARAFVADKLVWRDYAESIPWAAVQRLRPYTK
jgi:hypothetical protein